MDHQHTLYKPLLAASITGSSFLVGCQLSLSQVTLATLLTPSPHLDSDKTETTLLRQFRTAFWRGFRLCPSTAILSSLCCFINAGLVLSRTGISALSSPVAGLVPRRLLLAGAFMIGLIPFTLTFVVPVEEPLLKRVARLENNGSTMVVEDDGEGNTLALLDKWNVRNYIRAGIPAVGAAVAWSLWF